MPDGRLRVIQEIPAGEHLPVIIIVTAYAEFALDAFDGGAVDYLLRPVSQGRLVAAEGRQGAAKSTAMRPRSVSPNSRQSRTTRLRASLANRLGKLGAEILLLGTDEI